MAVPNWSPDPALAERMISSIVPRASIDALRMEKVMVSPVPKAAAMINVEIMMPTMMRMVCARRRGMCAARVSASRGCASP